MDTTYCFCLRVFHYQIFTSKFVKLIDKNETGLLQGKKLGVFALRNRSKWAYVQISLLNTSINNKPVFFSQVVTYRKNQRGGDNQGTNQYSLFSENK